MHAGEARRTAGPPDCRSPQPPLDEEDHQSGVGEEVGCYGLRFCATSENGHGTSMPGSKLGDLMHSAGTAEVRAYTVSTFLVWRVHVAAVPTAVGDCFAVRCESAAALPAE